MKAVLVFALRALVFFSAVLVKLYFRDTYVMEYPFETHVLLSSLQLCLIFAALWVYRACEFVVSTVHDGMAYTHVQGDGLSGAPEGGALEADGCDDEQPYQPSGIVVIVFADARALRQYVRKIHITAVLLWGTFYSFDVGTVDTLYYFVLGLFLGWVVSVWRQVRDTTSFKMRILYMFLCAAVLATNHPDDGLASGEQLVAVCLFPLVCGGAWMLWVDTETVCDDSQSVMVTCLLVCSLIVATSSWTVVRLMLESSRVVFVYLLILEPAIKGLALCVLVLSIHTKHKKQTMLVYTCAYAVACLYLHPDRRSVQFNLTLATTVVLMLSQTVSVVMHAT